jgi:large subunit ribosomal protein L9e
MKVLNTTQLVKIPEGIKITQKARVVTVQNKQTGSKLVRKFDTLPVDIKVKGSNVHVVVWLGNKRNITLVRTICSHIKNMIVGVTTVCVLFVFSE